MSEHIQNQENNEVSPTIIKVLGVGGGGSNAVKHMYDNGIINVDFFICNTDAQALEKNSVKQKIQIGSELTEGRGAGNNPEIGKKAAQESKEIIQDLLGTDTKMLFITAGMGGGTGTGAAPIIAEIAREMGILTVGIVTIPFGFEGKIRLKQAIKGVEEMEKNVDSLLVINNEKLRKIHGDQKISEAFSHADEVLAVAAKGIAEIITVHGQVNVDFADVETVMRNSGVAIMGSAIAGGENRSMHAIKRALNSPLLNSSDISGAQNVLLNVTSGDEEFRLDELGEITDFVQSAVKDDVQIIWGNGNDEELGEKIRVVIIATGFKKHDIHDVFAEEKKESEREVMILDDKKEQIKKPQITAELNQDEEIESGQMIYAKKDDNELESGQAIYALEDTEEIETGQAIYGSHDDDEQLEAGQAIYGQNEDEEIEVGQAIYAENDQKETLILEDIVEQDIIPQEVKKKEIQDEKPVFKETIFDEPAKPKSKRPTLEEERKKALQNKTVKRKKKSKSTGKKVGDWIQTTLDNMFNEEVQ